MSERPRLSVVVPTFQRRDLVLLLLSALERQRCDEPFEAVVVVDGSTDGTDAALRDLDLPFPLRIVSQPNLGLARARNHGARVATGEILLFLDDDMEPDVDLLAEHDAAHRRGADAVVGRIPLHPDSADTLLADGVRAWADDLARRLARSGYVPRFHEVVNGQMSIRRTVFERLGGFDERFTAEGDYGAEDLDFGHRLITGGWRIVHNPRAISRQRYVVDAAHHLRQYRQAGRAEASLVRKHPELLEKVFRGPLTESALHRWARAPVLLFPRLTSLLVGPVRRISVRLVDRGNRSPWIARAFFLARSVAYWRGVHEAGGYPKRRRVRVLCYHEIDDLGDDPVLAEYGVPPLLFESQIETLERAGYRFVHPDEVVALVEGRGGVPRRALLLTFDDGYRGVAEAAAPVLERRRIPAVVFVVADRLGKDNDWDRAIGARRLELLDTAELARLAGRGFEIASHGRTHRPLPRLDDPELRDEIAGSMRRLADLGLGAPRFFSFPHGEHDTRARCEASRAGYRAAFTVTPGIFGPRSDPLAAPRIEIGPEDRGWRLRLKVARGDPLRRWGDRLRHVARTLLRR